MSMHRIYVEFKGGYFITSIDASFNAGLQEMVEELGRPIKVEFRATDEGWHEDSGDARTDYDDDVWPPPLEEWT